MQQTLFYVPHFLIDGPLFWGWLVVGALICANIVRKHGWGQDAYQFLPLFLIVALALRFLFPSLEVTDIASNGEEVPVGIAVRGYGLFLLAGLVAGIGMSMLRARQLGMDPDRILSLAIWLVVCGIAGARLFYVIQKWDQFAGRSPFEMLDMTKGGLVVFGSVFGAMAGGSFHLWRNKLPILKTADIIAPGMVMGLALGRIGCLMNGCCFGGPCTIEPIGQYFPAGSPPYLQQLDSGELLGIHTKWIDVDQGEGNVALAHSVRIVDSIDPDSLAERYEIERGLPFEIVRPSDMVFRAIKQKGFDLPDAIAIRQDPSKPEIVIPVSELPAYSHPLFPAQLFSALNALLLSLSLWFFYPFRKGDGQVFALLLVFYSISRFLLETIRQDELGQFGTSLTISQWVSIMVLPMGIALFFMAVPRKVKINT